MAIEAVKGKTDAKPGQPAPGADAKAKLLPLRTGDATFLEITNNAWRVVVPAGVSAQELDLHPTFWNMLEVRAGDSIKALPVDRTWVAVFEVLDAGPGNVVAKLAYSMSCPLRSAASGKQIPDGWRIERTGPAEPDGWIATHPASGRKIMNSGMPWETHEDARRGLLDHAIFAGEQSTKYFPG